MTRLNPLPSIPLLPHYMNYSTIPPPQGPQPALAKSVSPTDSAHTTAASFSRRCSSTRRLVTTTPRGSEVGGSAGHSRLRDGLALGWAEGFLGKNEENQRDSKFQDTKKKWSAKKCGKNPFRREICFEKEGGVCVPKSQRMQNHPNWSSIWVWAVAHIFESWNIRPNHAEKLPCCSHMTAWVQFPLQPCNQLSQQCHGMFEPHIYFTCM